MEVSAASVTGYGTPEDFGANFDTTGQQDAPAQEDAATPPNDTAAPPGSFLPPDSAIHPSIAVQLMQGVVNGAKETASFVQNAIDEKKERLGSWIDSGEKYLEGKVDDTRAWLRENGGTLGQNISNQIGFGEGIVLSVYDAGKGIVQLADGAVSLANPLEWAANPQANNARLQSAVSGVETLGKLASLVSWVFRPIVTAHSGLS